MVLLVFLVAGLSSRYGRHDQFTGFESNDELKTKLKQFANIKTSTTNTTTFIEYSVRQALSTPFEAVVFITNPVTNSLFESTFGSSIYSCVREESIPVHYVQQTYPSYRLKPFGSADAVATIVPFLEDRKEYHASPLVIVNGDDLYGSKTYEDIYKLVSCGINVIGTLPFFKTVLDKKTVVNRGIVHLTTVLDDDLAVTKVSEMKECFNISLEQNPEMKEMQTNINCIGIQPDTLLSIQEHVQLGIDTLRHSDEKTRRSKEFILVDVLNQIIQSHDLTMFQFCLRHPICGITSMEDIERVENFIQSH